MQDHTDAAVRKSQVLTYCIKWPADQLGDKAVSPQACCKSSVGLAVPGAEDQTRCGLRYRACHRSFPCHCVSGARSRDVY
jgi:hypothetical protein